MAVGQAITVFNGGQTLELVLLDGVQWRLPFSRNYLSPVCQLAWGLFLDRSKDRGLLKVWCIAKQCMFNFWGLFELLSHIAAYLPYEGLLLKGDMLRP